MVYPFEKVIIHPSKWHVWRTYHRWEMHGSISAWQLGWMGCVWGRPPWENFTGAPEKDGKCLVWARLTCPVWKRELSPAKRGLPGDCSHRRKEHRRPPRAQQRTPHFLPIPCPRSSHDNDASSPKPTCSLRILLRREFWKPPHQLEMTLWMNPSCPLSQALEVKV